MNISQGISKFLLSSVGRSIVQKKINQVSFSRLFERAQNVIKSNPLSGFQLFRQQECINRQENSLNNLIMNNKIFEAISSVLERSKNLEIEDAILNVNTHQRKKAKVKREKLKQRRKKIRRLSERKREKYNY